MARIKKELTELIGGTPLLELSRLSRKHDAKAQVVAKLEYFNPGGSDKEPHCPGNDRGCGNKRHLETRSRYH